MTPIIAFERLFFAVFGQTSPDDINSQRHLRPEWTENLFKVVYGVYMLVSVVVLINLLIAMMSDTYQRIQVILEWKIINFCSSWCVRMCFFGTLCTCLSCFPSTVRMNPISSFELLFFAVFGQTTTEQTQTDKILNLQIKTQPYWTEYLFKIVFGIYMLVSVVVLINLLIAMMSDTYQRIQVLGDYLSSFSFYHNSTAITLLNLCRNYKNQILVKKIWRVFYRSFNKLE